MIMYNILKILQKLSGKYVVIISQINAEVIERWC